MRESHLKGEPTIYTIYIMGNGAPSYEDPLGMTQNVVEIQGRQRECGVGHKVNSYTLESVWIWVK